MEHKVVGAVYPEEYLPFAEKILDLISETYPNLTHDEAGIVMGALEATKFAFQKTMKSKGLTFRSEAQRKE